MRVISIIQHTPISLYSIYLYIRVDMYIDTPMYFVDFSLLRARTQCDLRRISYSFHFHICSYF